MGFNEANKYRLKSVSKATDLPVHVGFKRTMILPDKKLHGEGSEEGRELTF